MQVRRSTAFFALLACLGVLAGCATDTPKPTLGPEPDYYPLAVGDHWEYKLSPGTKVYASDVTATRQINGVTTYAVAIQSAYSFMAKQPDGIYQYGQSDPDQPSKAVIYDPPQLFYKLPFAAEETWEATAANDPMQKNGEMVTVSGRCNGFDTVTVPAGTFTNCAHLITDDPRDVPDNQTELWLAPNVGVVKTITYRTIGRGKPKPMTTELIRYKLASADK